MILKSVCNLIMPFFLLMTRHFFKEHECLKTLILHLSKDLENVVTWLKSNYLTLNIDKTKFLIFTHKEFPSGLNLRINDKILPIPIL